MKRLLGFLLMMAGVMQGQTAVLPVYSCVNPGVKAITSGVSSSNYLEGVIPSCLVKVYITGTTTTATIYKDSIGTPQDNPFKANTNGVIPPIYAATGAYDVVLSGGIPPNTYSIPSTLTGISAGGGNASGVTSLNTLTGALTLAAGTGLSVTQSGSTILISLGTLFSITSFTGGSTVEVGTSIVNPTFAATYSTTPASASITNTENISSPLALTTPFTSGTVTGTFLHTSPATTTFTLSATQGSTQTSTQSISWQYAIFGGVGTFGATSSVTSSGSTAVLSNGNILPRLQLGAETVGQTFGPFSPSGQVIYLLLTGGSHTFSDAITGFTVPFNAPITVSFLNAQGVTVTMYLYQTVNAGYTPITLKVTS